jgi:hypothetical protein
MIKDEPKDDLRNEAAALMVRTVRLAPELTSTMLWGLCRSKRHREAILTGPSGAATAALFALIPEARVVFASSRAGKGRIRAADQIGADTLASGELPAGLAALAHELPALALPFIRRVVALDGAVRQLEAELAGVFLDVQRFSELKLPPEAQKLFAALAALTKPEDDV